MVADRDKVKLNAACTIIDVTIVKRLSVYNQCLIDAVKVLDLPLLVGCLSEVRRKLEGMPLDENASRQRERFIKGVDALTEISEKWAAQVARHDEFQNIEDELTSVSGAIRDDFDTFLTIWTLVCEVIRGAGGDAWPEPLRAAADARASPRATATRPRPQRSSRSSAINSASCSRRPTPTCWRSAISSRIGARNWRCCWR